MFLRLEPNFSGSSVLPGLPSKLSGKLRTISSDAMASLRSRRHFDSSGLPQKHLITHRHPAITNGKLLAAEVEMAAKKPATLGHALTARARARAAPRKRCPE